MQYNTYQLKPLASPPLFTYFYPSHNNLTTPSEVIDTGINRVIDETEKDRPKKIWAKLKKMKGIAKADPELANKSVNEILYGDNGAWRGNER